MLISVSSLPVTDQIIERVAQNMRQDDVNEIWASQRLGPYEGLLNSVRVSDRMGALFVEDDLLGIWGLVIADGFLPAGVPWFIGTDEVDNHKVKFLKASRYIVREMQKYCPELANYVSVDSKRSIRYLRNLGFSFDEEPVPVGVKGEMFFRFEKGMSTCAIQSQH